MPLLSCFQKTNLKRYESKHLSERLHFFIKQRHKRKKNYDKEQSPDLKKTEMQVTTPGPKTVTISLQWQMQRTSTTMILQQAMDDRILKLSFSAFKQYLNFKHELLANFSKTVYF